MAEQGSKARIYKATKELQQKAGTGTVNERLVTAAQQTLESNIGDFKPMAKELLDNLQAAVSKMKASPDKATDEKQEAVVPVMQIKANAPMFGYKSVGQLASILLDFLEELKIFDIAAVEIVSACHQSMSLMIAKNIKSAEDQVTMIMRKEIATVIARYKDKFPQNLN